MPTSISLLVTLVTSTVYGNERWICEGDDGWDASFNSLAALAQIHQADDSDLCVLCGDKSGPPCARSSKRRANARGRRHGFGRGSSFAPLARRARTRDRADRFCTTRASEIVEVIYDALSPLPPKATFAATTGGSVWFRPSVHDLTPSIGADLQLDTLQDAGLLNSHPVVDLLLGVDNNWKGSEG